MARSSAEAIIIVLDVGPCVGNQVLKDGNTFLQSAQLCTTNIIQRNILSGSKNEIGLIFLGSEETNNHLVDDNGESYNNIEIAHTLELPTWKMIHSISKYKTCSSKDGDWLDALVVALDYMKTATLGKIFKGKKIVMLTNFCSKVSDAEVNFVIQGLQIEGVEVIAIGPDIRVDASEDISPQVDEREISMKRECELKTDDQLESEKLINYIVNKVEGSVICSFEDAIPQLKYFELQKCRPASWKVTMDIGSHIKIPVVGYKKVAQVKRAVFQNIVIPSQQNTSTGSYQDQASEKQFLRNSLDPLDADSQPGEEESIEEKCVLVDKDRIFQTVGDDAARVDISEVREGYMFGTTIVPVTDDDKPQLVYESGPRGLSVLGFTNEQNVPPHLFKGDGCFLIFAEKEQNSMRAFSALIQAMDSKNMVAITRKVYNRNGTPVICALFPVITPDMQYFVLIELPFAEDVKLLLFPPLVTENHKPSKEQLAAVDQLITSMDLMAVDDDEAYDPLQARDPYEQHFYNIVAKKALQGDLFIGAKDVSEAVKELLTPREDVLEAGKPALSRIKELFLLTEVTPKEGARQAAADVFKQDVKPIIPTMDQNATQFLLKDPVTTPRIGTVQPLNDFTNLMEQGVSLEEACGLLTKVVMDLIIKAFDEDDFGKPFKCLNLMRKKCTEKNPAIFNEWLLKFKKDLPVEKAGFWQLVVTGHLGLITSSESNFSTVGEEEAKRFLQKDEAVDDIATAPSLEEDVDDLINQM